MRLQYRRIFQDESSHPEMDDTEFSKVVLQNVSKTEHLISTLNSFLMSWKLISTERLD